MLSVENAKAGLRIQLLTDCLLTTLSTHNTDMVPLVPSSRVLTNFSCPTGSMCRERMRVGSRNSLPDAPTICICSIASRNDTQLSFHSSIPSVPEKNCKYTYNTQLNTMQDIQHYHANITHSLTHCCA